ncbi:protease, partial [Salmonella enterica]
MKKQTQLLSALALSVGLTLSAPFQAVASIPGQVPGQAALP